MTSRSLPTEPPFFFESEKENASATSVDRDNTSELTRETKEASSELAKELTEQATSVEVAAERIQVVAQEDTYQAGASPENFIDGKTWQAVG